MGPGRGPGRAAGALPASFAAGASGLGAGAGFGFAGDGVGAGAGAGDGVDDGAGVASAAAAGDGPGVGAPGLGPGRAGPGLAPEPLAPGLGAPPGLGADLAPSLDPEDLGNDSRSRRATGASTVDDADLTNSPCSFSRSSTCLLVTPSSLASSCTRALPATALLTCEVERAARYDLGLRPIRAHRGYFTVCS